MPGRKPSTVAHLFKDVGKVGKVPKVSCNFCSVEIAKNGTRMTNHIAGCKKCGEQIKIKYLTNAESNEPINEIYNCEIGENNADIEVDEIGTHEQESSNTTASKSTTQLNLRHVSAQQSSVERFLTPASTVRRPTTQKHKLKGQQGKRSAVVSLFSPQKNKINPYMDTMSDGQIEEAQLKMAHAIYASGCPLRMVDNILWQKVFHTLRPSFKLPTRDMLSNSLLETVYQEAVITAKELVADAQSVAIICDGWSNIRNEGIINFIVTVPQPIFWSSIPTGAESHTGQYMANVIKKVTEDVGPMKVIGICTDNATNMKRAWELIKQEFPHIQSYGCLAHALNLVFTDVSKIKSAEAIQRNATSIVKCVKKSQKLTALFCQHQRQSVQQHQQSLKLPVKTRWGSIIHCMESICSNKPALQALAINEEAKASLEPAIRKLLLSEVFWDTLEGYVNLLKPVADAIITVEGDNKHLSIVMKVFSELQVIFDNSLSSSPILKSEEASVKEIIPKRRAFLVRSVHLAANLLDPRYKGCHITVDESVDAMELIQELAEALPSVDGSQVLGELADYRSNERLFSKPFVWKAVSKTSPTSWWNGICSSMQLSQVASRILNLPPSSAAVERSFSRHAWIHSAKRNRLTTERAAKLVFISHNYALSGLQEQTRVTRLKDQCLTTAAAAGAMTLTEDVVPSLASTSVATARSSVERESEDEQYDLNLIQSDSDSDVEFSDTAELQDVV